MSTKFKRGDIVISPDTCEVPNPKSVHFVITGVRLPNYYYDVYEDNKFSYSWYCGYEQIDNTCKLK